MFKMAGILHNVHVTNLPGLGLLLVLWIVLFRAVHLLITLLRHEPLIGWAIGPFGITVMFVHEPSILFIWLSVIAPAVVSGGVLYVGFFTPLSPVVFPHNPLMQFVFVVAGMLISSLKDIFNTFQDLRHPLWGEARILRSIQWLRATWAKIHFTPFGYSYMNDHFGSNPNDLLRAL
jgi:hypothetical protein